jgi:putative ABC transport system ATP-binding protein
LPTLRAIDNVQVPMLALPGSSAQSRAERAEALLVELGLSHRINQYPNELSAGERQRVAIARALANQPSILLADEPTGNLDSVNSGRIMEILTGIQKKRGMTLIIVTHENDIANSAPRHIRIRDGRVEA